MNGIKVSFKIFKNDWFYVILSIYINDKFICFLFYLENLGRFKFLSIIIGVFSFWKWLVSFRFWEVILEFWLERNYFLLEGLFLIIGLNNEFGN